MAQGAGEQFRPQLELWPRPQRSGEFSLRFAEADGSETDLDARTLAHSIAEAGSSGDDIDWDTALGVARAALAFLRHSGEPEPIAMPVVAHTVERALREMGLGRTARIYRRNHDRAGASAADVTSGAQRWDTVILADSIAHHLRRWAERAMNDPSAAGELAAYIHTRMRAAGVVTATPGLLREWVMNELLARGLNASAERIAHVAVSVGDIEALHRGDGELPGPIDTAGAAQVTTAYAFSRVFPERVSRAHARGDLRIESIGDICRLERMALDLEGVKLHGSPNEAADANPPDPLTDPTRLARCVSQWTRALSRHVSGTIRWNAINFGYAPLLPRLDDRDLVRAAYALLFEMARSESAQPTPRTQLELRWDPPESFPEVLRGPEGAPVMLNDAYPPARRFFAAALEAFEGLSARRTSINFAEMHIVLSPYFFGSPDASLLLTRIARTAANGFPLALTYEPAQSLALDEAQQRACTETVAQTVAIDMRRVLRRAGGLNAALAYIESLVDDAVAAHLARHDHLADLAHHRNGPFGALRRPWVEGPLLDVRKLHYRVAITGLNEAAARAGDGGAELIDNVLGRARAICDRWAASTGRAIELSAGEPSAAATAIDARARIAGEAQLHPHFVIPAPCTIKRGPGLETPAQIADLIRWAFLNTPCRGLFLH